jgi:hypothetical protein
MDCHDEFGGSACEYLHEGMIEDATFQASVDSEALLQQPQDSTFQEGNQHVAATIQEVTLPFEMRSDPLAMPRTVSHQPSCDSLRNFAASADGRHSQTSANEIRTTVGAEYDSLPEEVRLEASSAAQYTIMTDMAESAWSVDDPRYGADLLDSLDSWTARDFSAMQAQLSDEIFERATAEHSSLPTFNRQEMIASGHDMQGIAWDDYGIDRHQCPCISWSRRILRLLHPSHASIACFAQCPRHSPRLDQVHHDCDPYPCHNSCSDRFCYYRSGWFRR